MTEAVTNTVLEVKKADWQQTRLLEEPVPNTLAPDQVLLRIDRQALTANNISYASAGDRLGYWQFFPTDESWGRIPSMGWANVVASEHPEISVGERVWGFFPIAEYLLINAGKVKPGQFSDVSPHREGLAPVYAQFDRASANPIYEHDREDQDSLLRGLFMTSWLVNDFLGVNENFEASLCLITSASSKTSIALAHCVHSRCALKTVALTSAKNKAFCESLSCYDLVVTYDDIASIEALPAVLVDMAGSVRLLESVHNHWQDALKHSCRIGATHYDEMGPTDHLPGPTPTFFFAPTHVQTRSAELGAQELMMRLGTAYVGFRIFCDSWLDIRRSYGQCETEKTYQKVLAGDTEPHIGEIVSMRHAP